MSVTALRHCLAALAGSASRACALGTFHSLYLATAAASPDGTKIRGCTLGAALRRTGTRPTTLRTKRPPRPTRRERVMKQPTEIHPTQPPQATHALAREYGVPHSSHARCPVLYMRLRRV
jgi:hypothetical protein